MASEGDAQRMAGLMVRAEAVTLLMQSNAYTPESVRDAVIGNDLSLLRPVEYGMRPVTASFRHDDE